jgi:hypothetical protein
MDTYAPNLLKAKDLVLLESCISRFKIQEEDDKGKASTSAFKAKGKTQQWDKWRAHLELKSISLISKAPDEDEKAEDDETSEVTI